MSSFLVLKSNGKCIELTLNMEFPGGKADYSVNRPVATCNTETIPELRK